MSPQVSQELKYAPAACAPLEPCVEDSSKASIGVQILLIKHVNAVEGSKRLLPGCVVMPALSAYIQNKLLFLFIPGKKPFE